MIDKTFTYTVLAYKAVQASQCTFPKCDKPRRAMQLTLPSYKTDIGERCRNKELNIRLIDHPSARVFTS